MGAEPPGYEETAWPAASIAQLAVALGVAALVLPPMLFRRAGGPEHSVALLFTGLAVTVILILAVSARPLRVRVTPRELLLSGGLPPAPSRLALSAIDAVSVAYGFRPPFGSLPLGRAQWLWWGRRWAFGASFDGSLGDCFRKLDGVEIALRGGASLFVESWTPAALVQALSAGSWAQPPATETLAPAVEGPDGH